MVEPIFLTDEEKKIILEELENRHTILYSRAIRYSLSKTLPNKQKIIDSKREKINVIAEVILKLKKII